MIKKISIGIFFGALVGIFVTAVIISNTNNLQELFFTKITETSIITGFLCGIYAHLSKSKLQVFLVSILIGMATFYIKYLITGHDFDAITMGTFVGAMLGGTLSVIRKIEQSLKFSSKISKRQRKGFGNYS